jgi:hypothetical protein
MTRNIGIILLALYLLIVGVLALTNIQIVAVNIVQGVLAIGAAICLVIGK